MQAQHLDRIREETELITVNSMLKDGWVLLHIADSKKGHTYILGKRTTAARANSVRAFTGGNDLPSLGTAQAALEAETVPLPPNLEPNQNI